MAFQPETQTYEAGVYQLETTDPVQGGVGGRSNLPLLHLSNRTAWLKQQVDDLLLDVAAAATANSPTFTGDPKAPTATAGDNDTSIATTEFVQYALSGVLSLSVAGTGSTTLTTAQAGAGVLVLTGALTGARTVVVPNTGRWIVRNATTGAFSLTVKTAAGTGVVIPQGTATEVFADGTNAYFSDNVFSVAGRVGAVTLAVADVSGAAPLASPTFTGDPKAPTPAQFDNDTTLATTEFVQRALGNMAGVKIVSASETLQAADAGKLILANIASSGVLTLPVFSSVAPGAKFYIQCGSSTSAITVNAPSGMSFAAPNGLSGGGNSLVIQPGVAVEFIYLSSSSIIPTNGAGISSLTNSGYQKLPSGMIIQWGTTSLSAVGSFNQQVIAGVTYYTHYYTINYPIAFTVSTYASIVSIASSDFANQGSMAGHSVSSNLNGNGSPLTRHDVAVTTTTLGYAPVVHWMVIGR